MVRLRMVMEVPAKLAKANRAKAMVGGKTELAGQQRRLAGGADFLNELMAMLRADADDESGEIRDTLDDINVTNPPGEISQTMRDAADDLEQGMPRRAASSAAMAARSLADLANALSEARSRHAQPNLEELVETEQELADLLAALKRASSAEEVAMLAKKADQSKERVSELANGDSLIAQAEKESSKSSSAQSNANASQTGSANNASGAGKITHRGWRQSQQVLAEELRQLDKALQSSIQEAILAATLQDGDGAVPSNYKDLVDEYYRVLSDDLR